jgi:hypothetical protein
MKQIRRRRLVKICAIGEYAKRNRQVQSALALALALGVQESWPIGQDQFPFRSALPILNMKIHSANILAQTSLYLELAWRIKFAG